MCLSPLPALNTPKHHSSRGLPASLQRYTLQPQYADALSRVFGTAPQPLTTAAAINAWVSEATRGKISEIVDEGAISQVGG